MLCVSKQLNPSRFGHSAASVHSHKRALGTPNSILISFDGSKVASENFKDSQQSLQNNSSAGSRHSCSLNRHVWLNRDVTHSPYLFVFLRARRLTGAVTSARVVSLFDLVCMRVPVCYFSCADRSPWSEVCSFFNLIDKNDGYWRTTGITVLL